MSFNFDDDEDEGLDEEDSVEEEKPIKVEKRIIDEIEEEKVNVV